MKDIKTMGLVLITLLLSNQTYSLAKISETSDSNINIRGVNAPVLNIYEVQNEDGTKIIKVDAYDNDYESGIAKIELPDGTFVMVEDGQYVIHSQYIPPSSGTYIFKAYDKNNNITEKSITININEMPPMLDVYILKEDKYANTTTIQVNSWVEAVGGAKLSRIEFPDGSTISASPDSPYNISTTFTATKTGNYTFKSYDRQGLFTEKTIFVQLDDTSPNMEVFLSNSITDPSKRVIHIDAWDNDHESGIHRIEGPNNTVYTIKNNDQYSLNVEYTPTKDGIHTFRAYDRAGNFIEKSIDFINNVDFPKIVSKVDVESNRALITLDVWTENGNPLSKIKMPDGGVVYADPNEYSKTITFETNKEGIYDFMVIDDMGYSTKKRVTVTLDDFNIEHATKLVEKAELSKMPDDIATARTAVNNLLESISKDFLQDRLNTISIDIILDKKSATANMDIYIKSENMLSLSLDTNNITFDDFSGVEDVERLNVVNLTISSSLPYKINAYLATEIQNADKSKTMNKSILNIKANSEPAYKEFVDIVNPVLLLDNQSNGNNISHGIDIKLKGNIAHEKDVYKTTIKFEVKQK